MVCFDEAGKYILSGITMHIPEGRTVGVIGASGAGKTTLLKLACGLLLPDSGKVYVMGKKAADRKKSDCRDLSAFFADLPLLNESDTVSGNFETLGMIYRLSGEAFRRDYGELSRRLGFAEYAEEPVRSLSLGQRRCAELGAALLHRPRLLVLDEPAAGIDERAKQEFRILLAERKQSDNMTVIVSSHDMAAVSGLCDRLAILKEGKLLFYGEKEVLRRSVRPWEELILKVSGRTPDLEDLPLKRYSFDGEELRMVYRADHITAAEILQYILSGCTLTQAVVKRPGLEEILEILTMQWRETGYSEY